MRLLTAKLSNFCQHRDLTVGFSPGVNGIFGPNGCGKSNLLRAIYFAFTGETPNIGSKSDDISNGADKGFVEVEFEVNGEVGSIRRQLRTSTCVLKLGDQRFGSAKEVNANLWPILGVSKDLLGRTIFVHQEQLDSVIFERPAERNAAFQRLFKTYRSEEIREVLHGELSRVQVVSYDERIDEMERELREVVSVDLTSAIATKEAAETELATIDETALRNRMAAHSNADLELRKLHTLVNELNAAKYDRVKANDIVQSVSDAVTTLECQRDEIAGDLPKLQARYQELLVLQRDRQTLESLSAEAKTLASSRRDPPVPPGYPRDEVPKAEDFVQQLSTDIEINHRFVTAIRADGKCAFCQSVVDQAPQKVATAQSRAVKLAEQHKACLEEFTRLRAGWSEYDISKSTHDEWARNYQIRCSHVMDQLKAIGDVPPVYEEQLTEVAAALQKYRLIEDDLTVRRQQFNTARDRRASLDTTIVLLEERNKMALELHKQLMDSEAYEEVRLSLIRADELRRTVGESEGKIGTLTQQQETQAAKLEDMKQKEAESGAKRKYQDLLTRSRVVLHRDRLPNVVAQSFRDALNSRLFKYLSLFEAPFSCALQQDLSFVCSFPGGWQPDAGRLSGGERVVLAIAFRFAVNDLFASQLGLLALDEPTRWLDDGNIDHVINILDRTKKLTSSGAWQVLVVTHADALKSTCDNRIVLG